VDVLFDVCSCWWRLVLGFGLSKGNWVGDPKSVFLLFWCYWGKVGWDLVDWVALSIILVGSSGVGRLVEVMGLIGVLHDYIVVLGIICCVLLMDVFEVWLP